MDIKKFDQIRLNHTGSLPAELTVPLNASKSESNRALLIQALSKAPISIENVAIARDTETMQRLLSNRDANTWDVLDAGTTMRFLTAYLAVSSKEPKTITGTARMQQRPIKLLADALQKLGADIRYENEEGYPPLTITSLSNQMVDTIEIPGNISSQYISALLMIAPTLPKGLTITLTGEIFSRPYIEMTLGLMQQFGIQYRWDDSRIHVESQPYSAGDYRIESDWSGASYWYSVVALAQKGSITLQGLREKSFQGDQKIAEIMKGLGVKTSYMNDQVLLEKGPLQSSLTLDFKDCPDLAQTVMAVAAIKGTRLHMTGLESLKIKETDRIAAMRAELSKIGARLIEEGNNWILEPSNEPVPSKLKFKTYEDHRMAMALAPLALLTEVIIEEPAVVNKSYPDFWEHFVNAGFEINEG